MAHAKVYEEAVKQQFVNHWDLDYMTREQIETAFLDGERQTARASCGHCEPLASDSHGRWARFVRRLRAVLKR